MKVLYCFVLLSCFYIKTQAQSQSLVLTESPVTLVSTDGVLEKEEWLGAKTLTLKGVSGHEVSVLVKYDADNLYVAFKNLKDAQNINFNAEVLIHTQMDDLHWNDHCYWFHASYGNCAATGQYYDWEGCTSYPDGWAANTFPFTDGNSTMEFKISFSKLNMVPLKGQRLKMAFKISDPLEQHAYWPEVANIANPDTWGTLTFN